jgi:2'-5' RNA ligase
VTIRRIGLGLALVLPLAAGFQPWPAAGAVQPPATDSQAIDVFVLPPAQIEDLVGKAGNELANVGLQTLYRRGFLPHVTLYLSAYERKDLGLVRQRVRQLAARFQPFDMHASGCSLTPSHWLFIDVQADKPLRELADTATIMLSPLHDVHQPAPAWLKDAPHKLESFQRFGSPNVFADFQPHLTQLAHDSSPALTTWFKTGACHGWSAEGPAAAIGFAPVDADGQVLRGQAEIYPLAKSP